MSGPVIVPGRVVDVNGNGVPSVAVAFVDGPAPFPDIAAISDGVGMFTLTAPTPGHWVVAANSGNQTYLVEVDVPASEVLEVRLG